MPKTAFRRTVITAGVAAALSAGVVALPTFAQNSGSTATTTVTAPSATATTPGSAAAPKMDRSERHAEYRAALAKELGISVEKLEAAETAAREAVFLANLDEMVDAGRITDAQAKELRDAAAAGNLTEKLGELRLAQMKERLDQAVADGRLTREQADEMLERAEERLADGEMYGRGFGPGGHGGPGGPGGFGRGGHHGPGGGFPGP